MIAVIVVNYRRPDDTVDCLRSLERSRSDDFDLFVVDNGVHSNEMASVLRAYLDEVPRPWLFYRSNPHNAGFAGPCNTVIGELLDTGQYSAVALVNNDAEVDEAWLHEMHALLDPAAGVQMIAARMMRHSQPDLVDSLGIALYRSGIAANRKLTSDPLLGPCGGAALYGTDLLAKLREVSGHVFDPVFFCYAEDTDLAIRARLLGYQAAYAESAIVWHKGSATSGGADSDFVMYHGLRNTLHTMRRNLPIGFLLRFWPWILMAQLGIVLKYLCQGRFGVLLKVYRDALRGRTGDSVARRRLRNAGVLRWSAIAGSVVPRLYDSVYIREQLQRLIRRSRVGRRRSP